MTLKPYIYRRFATRNLTESCVTCKISIRLKEPLDPLKHVSKRNDRVRFLAKRHPARALLLTIILAGSAAPASDWTTDGDFRLVGRSNISNEWTLPLTQWRSTRAFEKSETGYEKSSATVLKLDGSNQIARLLSLIASVEAPERGYDAVHHRARVMPPALPSNMTLQEIFDWIKRTPNQHHAIGRYQIIPDTLADLVRSNGIDLSRRFDPELQDHLAMVLLERAGYNKFNAGLMGHATFMDAIARVWAGLPLANGKSAYQGVAGNRAVISRHAYQSAMRKIFP